MLKSLSALTVTLFLGVSAVEAQMDDPFPGSDSYTLTVYGGGFTPAADVGINEFGNSATVGGTVGAWFGEYVGVRANLAYGQSKLKGPAGTNSMVGQHPNVWLYDGDLLLRYPVETFAGSWVTPYAIAGLGAKSYDFENASTETFLAANYGVGLEYRFATAPRVGLQLEARDFVSNFDVLGSDEWQHDFVWTGGLTFNF